MTSFFEHVTPLQWVTITGLLGIIIVCILMLTNVIKLSKLLPKSCEVFECEKKGLVTKEGKGRDEDDCCEAAE